MKKNDMKNNGMSKDLEKLAAEIRKAKPSKDARAAAMEVAMSAFSDEFLPETAAAKVDASAARKNEKNLDASQGLTNEPRPTGQSIRTRRVQTFGRDAMSKFSNLINFKPQTMMMAGSCAAALIAGLIIVPNMAELELENVGVPVVPVAETAVPDAPAPDAAETLSKLDRAASEISAPAAPTPAPAAKADETAPTAPAGDASEAPTTIEVDRRVVKTPARVVERDIPAVTKMETRRIQKEDGSFETVQTPVEVREANNELVTIPPTFETIRDTVEVAPDGTQTIISSEVVPPSFEAPAETVAVKPASAGLAELPPGNPMPAPEPMPAPAPQGGITSVDSLLNSVRKDSARVEAENRARVQEFRQMANRQSGFIEQKPSAQKAEVSGRSRTVTPGGDKSASVPASPAPLPQKIAGLTVDAGEPKFETRTETIVLQPASVEYVAAPATYETVKETVVVQEASTELVTIPGEYEWVDGEIEGSTTEIVTVPAEYETVTETIVVQNASTELVSIPPSYQTVQETIVLQPEYIAKDGSVVPAITEEISRQVVKTPARTTERAIPAKTSTVTRRVVKTPAKTVERVVPYETKDGKTRVQITPSRTAERSIPAVTKTETRRVIKTPASTVERTIPAVTKQVQVRVLAPSKVYLRDDDGNVVREFENSDAFEIYKANLPTPVQEKPVSTFSVDVDTASYSFLRASINRGQLPPRESIRLEEMINYFPYDYDAPKSADEPFKANVTVTSNPWNADTKLMHIGIKGYVPKDSEKPRSNLVFLIDTSGSMNRANKLPLLINSFKLLLNTLDEDDTVSIVAYASASGTVLEPTRVKDKDEILAALNRLRAGGSTAGAAGLELAYKNAEKNFDDEGNNRVILATDGDFNVGFSSPDDMKKFISEKRDTGISLSVLGFGMGNYNDHLMQSLAQNGNGVAAYIDSLAEAQKVLANEAGSNLITIAKDVKIQVEFNPATIAEYRLIGYETRALKRQDFNNDKVDAGEIGAGHSVTAIYEMTPVDSPAVTMDKLRYVSDDTPKATGSDEYAFVKIRHKLPDADKSTLQTIPIGKGYERKLKHASDDMRFATAVAAVGQKLRGDTPVEDYSYEDIIKLAKKAKGKDENGYRAEFIQMVKLIETMEK